MLLVGIRIFFWTLSRLLVGVVRHRANPLPCVLFSHSSRAECRIIDQACFNIVSSDQWPTNTVQLSKDRTFIILESPDQTRIDLQLPLRFNLVDHSAVIVVVVLPTFLTGGP